MQIRSNKFTALALQTKDNSDILNHPAIQHYVDLLDGITTKTLEVTDFRVPSWSASERLTQVKDLFRQLKNEYSKIISLAHRKKFAQFFTPFQIADLMTKWILGNKCVKQLEKIGKIDFVQDRAIPENSKFLSVTVSKNSGGQYFASVLVETIVEALPKTGKTVGCDVGLKSFLVTSDNETFENPRYFRESQAKIQKAQRHLSRKQKGSNRYSKQKRKLAKVHLKVANQRSHFLHQVTNHLVKNYDEIVIEDLNVSGMTKNRKLAKSITDASFSAFRSQMTYKCQWYGKKLTLTQRFYPSSKTCSACGTVKSELTLKQRTFDCGHCGVSLDRDYNAAINLHNKAVGVHTA